MDCFEKNGNVIIENAIDFLPSHTFLCGQCFRWDQTGDESFVGVANGKVIEVSYDKNILTLKNTNLDDFNNIWKNYFDFDNDYSKIKTKLSIDDNLKNAMKYGWGIRILNQNVFECLVSFIISAQNQIPRIKKIVARLCEAAGEKITYNGKDYYSFPTPEAILSLSRDEIDSLKAGYRADYIIDAAKKVSSGEINLDLLYDADTASARKELLKIKGVGPKVADCVLLFSLKKHDAFPIDVWIGRVMKKFYLGNDASLKQIALYSAEKFGDLSGFAQQYLFYYARENKLID